LIKQHSKFILFLLVLILLFIPVITVEAQYSTGYLDFDFYNLNSKKFRINTDYSFFLKNETKNNLSYTLKYDKNQNIDYKFKKEHFWLDRSILLKDFSGQSKYLKLKYDNSNLIYGRYQFQIDSTMFSNYYYNNLDGVKFTHENDKRSANVFISRMGQVSITDRIFNPSYSVIFLNNDKIIRESEMVYVNTLNKDNEVLRTNYLRKKLHYKIDYLKGKVTFKPLIYFLNQPEYNYELIINYKIKESGFKYLNRGYNLKTKLTSNTSLKIYEVNEQSQKNIKGMVLSFKPKRRDYYELEYQQEQENNKKVNISNDNGGHYLQNIIKNSKTDKMGIRYFNEINSNNKIQGHSYKFIINSPYFGKLDEFEHFIKYNSNLNENIRTEIIYRSLDNDQKHSYDHYQTNLINQINEKLILKTSFKYINGTSGITKEKSLSNFFEYKYSENLDISWGYLHNMPRELYYGQYVIRYKPKNNSHIIFSNQVKDTDYRVKRFEYKMDNDFKIFKTIQETLSDKSIVNKNNGLKYRINNENTISFINSTHQEEVNGKENIVKYKFDFNKTISAGLNQRTYYTNLNGALQKKKRGTKIYLNLKKKGNTFEGSFDKERNITNTFKKERLKVSYHNRNISKFYFFTGIEKEFKKEKAQNIIVKYSNLRFKIKYRPFNNKNNLSYSYLKQNSYTKNLNISNEENTVNQTLDFSYFFNTKLSLNTSYSKWERTLKKNQQNISNVFSLKRLGLKYRYKKRWTFKGEYRILDKTREKSDSGYLISIQKHINKKLSLGIEYNFTDFNNNLNNLSYDNNGLSFNINYKW